MKNEPHSLPLALAVIELRHPESAPLSRSHLAAIEEGLREQTPVYGHEVQTLVRADFGPTAANGLAASQVVDFYHFMSRTKETAVTFGPDLISVKTTSYKNWDWLKNLFLAALKLRNDLTPLVGIERLGCRYIDEIRVPGAKTADWSQWISEDLLASNFSGVRPKLDLDVQMFHAQYKCETPNVSVTTRYGLLSGPPTVTTSEFLVRKNSPEDGQFFLLDTDSAWQLGIGEEIQAFDLKGLVSRVDELHSLTKSIFEYSITEKLRDAIFPKGGAK